MLSVINRGTVSGGETGGLAYKIINGYPTHVVLPVTLGGIDIVNVPINPIIKNGYTPVNVEIEVN